MVIAQHRQLQMVYRFKYTTLALCSLIFVLIYCQTTSPQGKLELTIYVRVVDRFFFRNETLFFISNKHIAGARDGFNDRFKINYSGNSTKSSDTGFDNISKNSTLATKFITTFGDGFTFNFVVYTSYLFFPSFETGPWGE